MGRAEQRKNSRMVQKYLLEKKLKDHRRRIVEMRRKEAMYKAIGNKALEINKETGADKFYFMINQDDIKDIAILIIDDNDNDPVELGIPINITLEDGTERENNVVIKVYIKDGAPVFIFDKDEKVE